ncbi:hypothetical protein [Clostridium rectalis]|uniref:hypothetical protein n=1 Tax=Clostridium rectalis TaxID=2040295 RepID=UPI000F63E761|nr:hypothetical protein [Clostridium rectalis]
MKSNYKALQLDDGFIIVSYLLTLSITLLSYLLILIFKCEQFTFDIYKKFYMYFMIFQFILFSLSIMHFNEIELNSFKVLLRDFSKVLILAFSIIPLIFIIFIVGNVMILNFWIPIVLQVIYGVAILTFKHILSLIKYIKEYTNFIIHFSMFFINILSLLFLYIYYRYSQVVITTIYDKDIPSIFFINPILTITGYINKEITDYSQLGIKPVIIASIFWSICILVNVFVLYKVKLSKKNLGGKNFGMDKH